MRVLGLGIALAFALGANAMAGDFIAVSSNDPGIRPGQALNAGGHIALPPGASLTLIRPSGEVLSLRGAVGGVTLPGPTPARANQYAAVQSLFTPPPAGRTFGARRGFCPGPEVLDSIEAILRADKSGCKKAARAAFRTYLIANGVSESETDQIYAAPPARPAPGARGK
jgi:hypothetical protein